MRLGIIFLLLLVFSCANTQNIALYNPFPDKEMIISSRNAKCFSTSEIKVWYALYGSYLINTLNIKEIFPSSEHSYRIEQVSTSGDKIISVFTGLFFSINRQTLKIDTCETIKKNDQTESKVEEKSKPEEKSTPEQGAKLSDLEKEVAYLKGKLNGIESAFPMISSLTGNREEIRSNREEQMNNSMSYESNRPIIIREKDYIQTKEVSSVDSKKQLHSYFLFKINSYNLTISEKKKIEKLRTTLNNQKNKVLVVGYSDIFGKFNPNLNLSWKRAIEVKNILVKLGIDESRIQLSAGGVTGNAKDAKFSRRVDLFVLGDVK